MSGKYMKIKRIIIPTITMLIIASQLFSCASASKQEAYDMLQQSTEIELEVAVPENESDIVSTDASQQVELLSWIQLADLETHPELRVAFEELLGITKEDDGTKSGIVYTDENGDRNQNNTLYNALGNTNFTTSYISDAEQISKIEEIANNEYTDIEENQGVPAVINAYFELLPDEEAGQFDGSATISRAQAMTLVMRATTPVNEQGAPEVNADFTSVVGETQYTDFAAPMNEYVYISTENGLNTQTFDSAMSRGEYIYFIMNLIFADYEGEIPEVALTSLTDAGDISFSEAISNATNGVPSDMYTTLKNTTALGIIDEESLDWDSSITKADAVQLLVTTIKTYNELKEGDNDSTSTSTSTSQSSEAPEIEAEEPPYTTVEQGAYPDNRSDHQQAWDTFCKYFNESDYGTTTKGKGSNDLPYVGPTGYDARLLEERTTDKGYTVLYDTSTGRVYYSGMVTPDGSDYIDMASDTVICQYCLDNNIASTYDLTYAQLQELLGVYNGN